MKFIKKPIKIKAVQTNISMVIKTLEGDYLAKTGDFIVTGIDGEEYPIGKEKFKSIYESTSDSGYYVKKPIPVFAYPLGDQIIEIKKSKGTLHSIKSDWLIFYDIGDCYPCKSDIFYKTYEPIDEEAKEVWSRVYK